VGAAVVSAVDAAPVLDPAEAAPAPERSARESRAEAADAQDALETVACMASLSDAEADARHAGSRVEAAVAPILNGGIDRVLSEAQGLRDELDRKHALLIWLGNLLPPGGDVRQSISAALPPLPPPGVMAPPIRRRRNGSPRASNCSSTRTRPCHRSDKGKAAQRRPSSCQSWVRSGGGCDWRLAAPKTCVTESCEADQQHGPRRGLRDSRRAGNDIVKFEGV
jgi:hypothetical protein